MSLLKKLAKEPGLTDLSSYQYAECKGGLCPVCRSDDSLLLVESTTQIGEIIIQDIKCQTCESEWQEEYSLIGYSDLKYGEKFIEASRSKK